MWWESWRIKIFDGCSVVITTNPMTSISGAIIYYYKTLGSKIFNFRKLVAWKYSSVSFPHAFDGENTFFNFEVIHVNTTIFLLVFSVNSRINSFSRFVPTKIRVLFLSSVWSFFVAIWMSLFPLLFSHSISTFWGDGVNDGNLMNWWWTLKLLSNTVRLTVLTKSVVAPQGSMQDWVANLTKATCILVLELLEINCSLFVALLVFL